MTSRTPTSRAPDAPDWRLAPWAERMLIALAACALLIPGLGTVAGLDAEVPRDTPAAVAPVTSLADAARRFERRFAFRPRLVRWQAALRYRLLGVSPLPTVLAGRDGWWYYADDGALEDAGNTPPFSAAELDHWRTTLQRTADWLAARGIAYVFVVAPGKPAIYPEYLPAALHRRAGPSRADQLVAMLRARTTVPVVDLAPALLAARTHARIYHRTDSHWNDLGAAIAYREILTAVRAQAPDVPAAAPAEAFRVDSREVPGLDLAEMTGLTDLIVERDLTLVPRAPRRARVIEPANPLPQFADGRLVTAIDDATLPRAVIYRDSFGSALVPFLAEHFSRAVFLWEYDVMPATVRAERPRVVIQEWAGRRLHTQAPYDAVAADGAASAPAISNSPAGRR